MSQKFWPKVTITNFCGTSVLSKQVMKLVSDDLISMYGGNGGIRISTKNEFKNQPKDY